MTPRAACLALLLAALSLPGCADRAGGEAAEPAAPDVLLLIADDLDRDSVGAFGGRVAGATPSIDALAARGVAFRRAHVAVSKCHPSRAALLTGLHPHRGGTMTAEPLRDGVTILPEILRRASYLTGAIGKVGHMPRAGDAAWDAVVRSARLGRGREPAKFGAEARRFIEGARAAGRPYFLAVSTHDPHRPFPGSDDERAAAASRPFPPAPRVFEPSEVVVPGFLPDLPEIRREVAQYFAAVHRADASVGAVIAAVEDVGRPDDTLVVFLSDNGASFPFAKANVYPRSTLTPLVLGWPGRIAGGTVDDRTLVAEIDLAPTILELIGVPAPADVRFDGSSFAAAVTRGTTGPRVTLVTAYHGVDELEFPMRALYFERFVYIYNAWSDGRTRFVNEAQSGLTMRAMIDAAGRDPAISARVAHYLFRAPEELYDVEADPDALRDLAGLPEHAATRERGRVLLREELRAAADPLLDRFAREPFSARD